MRKQDTRHAGAVVGTEDPALPWRVLGSGGAEIEAASLYLRELLARDNTPDTCRSYAYDLLGWFRFLDAGGLAWDQASRDTVRNYVLHLKTADNPYRYRGPGQPVPGSINVRTGKPYLRTGYAPRTLNHRLSVLRSFYDFHIAEGRGPARNPVPDGTPGMRANSHHNPLEPWPVSRRGAYRQKVEDRAPRAIADDLFDEAFRLLTSHRDRALFCCLVSTGGRAREVLGIRGCDLDWGNQRIQLVTKGTRAKEWVSASPETFLWIRLYLEEGYRAAPNEPLWWTLRAPRHPLGYSALRAVLTRVNQELGSNLVLHDFRHTCAIRLANDPAVSPLDLKTHLRHHTLASTEPYLKARTDEVVARIQAHQRQQRIPAAAEGGEWIYDARDLEVLLGKPGP